MKRKYILLLLCILHAALLQAQNPWLVKQINEHGNALPPNPDASDKMYNLGGTIAFFANDSTHGTELWTSDGTADGTVLLSDLTPGSESSVISYSHQAGNILYFWKTNVSLAGNTYVLWRTDGTASGTFPIFSDSVNRRMQLILGSSNANILNVASIGSNLYFIVYEPVNNVGHTNIYKADGPSGAVSLYLQSRGQIGAIGACNNEIYINANWYYGAPGTINIGMETYVYPPDNLPAGWADYDVSRDFSPGAADTKISEFVNVNDYYMLFYGTVTQNAATSCKLMRMRDTDVAPVIIGDIPQNGFYTNFNAPDYLSASWNESWAIGDKYFFRNGLNGTTGYKFTVTNGEASGTFSIHQPSAFSFSGLIGRTQDKVMLGSVSFAGKPAFWDGADSMSYIFISDSLSTANVSGISRAQALDSCILFFTGDNGAKAVWQAALDGSSLKPLLRLSTGYMGGVALGNSYFGWGEGDGTFQYAHTYIQPVRIKGNYKIWTGNLSESWNEAANWQPSGIPQGGDDAYIPAAIHNPRVDSNAHCRDLYINNGILTVDTAADLTINGNLSVCGTLQGDGAITRTGAYSNKTYGNGTTAIGRIYINGSDIEYNVENGVISSLAENLLGVDAVFDFQTDNKVLLNNTSLVLRKYPFVLEGGRHRYFATNKKGVLSYNVNTAVPDTLITIPVGIDSAAAAVALSSPYFGGSSLYVNVSDSLFASGSSGPPIAEKAVGKTWFIHSSAAAPVSVTLSWNATDTLPGFNPAACFIAHWDGGNWEAGTIQSAAFTDSAYSIRQDGYTSFSPFIVVTGNTPEITIAASDEDICAGTAVTFTADVAHGGEQPHYQWRKNGYNVGADTSVYTDNGLNNNDTVICRLTSNERFANPSQVSSDPVVITVHPVVAPAVTITSDAAGDTVCAGTAITFTATPLDAGTDPQYYWMLNGSPVDSGSDQYVYSMPGNNDIVQCTITANAACMLTDTAVSGPVTVSVSPLLVPALTITASDTFICAGTNISFTATAVNGGANPVYQWERNGSPVGISSGAYASGSLNDGDVISCILVSNEACVTADSVTAPGIAISVNPLVAPAVYITAPDTSICSGTPVTFTATATDGGTAPVYQWEKNGSNVGANNPVYTDASLDSGDVITCTMSSNAACASPADVTAAGIIMQVHPLLTPAISISGDSAICAGTMATFTATAANEGTAPIYQWMVNGNNTGSSNLTYAAATLADGDVITCSLSSNAACLTDTDVVSLPVTMAVAPVVVPAVSIAASDTSVCEGLPVTFTATTTNGGNNPVYQWQINGLSTGANSSVLTVPALAGGDTISCILISSAACADPAADTSAPVIITVNAAVMPAIHISNTPATGITPGTPVTFTASVSNEGTHPEYAWFRNGVPVASAAEATYTAVAGSGFNAGDTLFARLISDASCAAPDTVFSNSLVMEINPVGIEEVVPGASSVKLYPNPNNGRFRLAGVVQKAGNYTVVITNLLGEEVFRQDKFLNKGSYCMDIRNTAIAPGAYFLRLYSGGRCVGQKTFAKTQ